MQTKFIIHLDREDTADVEHLMQAFNMLGGSTAMDGKPFSKIRGNDFTFDDVLIAMNIIRERYEEIIKEQEVFSDPEKQKVWMYAVRENGRRGLLLAEQFFKDLQTDLQERA